MFESGWAQRATAGGWPSRRRQSWRPAARLGARAAAGVRTEAGLGPSAAACSSSGAEEPPRAAARRCRAPAGSCGTALPPSTHQRFDPRSTHTLTRDGVAVGHQLAGGAVLQDGQRAAGAGLGHPAARSARGAAGQASCRAGGRAGAPAAGGAPTPRGPPSHLPLTLGFLLGTQGSRPARPRPPRPPASHPAHHSGFCRTST